MTNDGQVLDASLYQSDPDKFLEKAKLLLRSQADRMSEMLEQLEIQKGYFQRSGNPNATNAVASINQFEAKLQYVLVASAKVQDDLAASNTLSVAESANFLRALRWNNDLLQTGEHTIQVLKEQTGA